MRSIINELWHGNIIPQEDSRTNSNYIFMDDLFAFAYTFMDDLLAFDYTFMDELF